LLERPTAGRRRCADRRPPGVARRHALGAGCLRTQVFGTSTLAPRRRHRAHLPGRRRAREVVQPTLPPGLGRLRRLLNGEWTDRRTPPVSSSCQASSGSGRLSMTSASVPSGNRTRPWERSDASARQAWRRAGGLPIRRRGLRQRAGSLTPTRAASAPRGSARTPDREQVPGAGQSPELVFASILEVDVRSRHEVDDGS
jgi:hypothetical protein